MLCGVALQTASQSFGEFLGGRVVIGFGITIALVGQQTTSTRP